MTPPQAIEDGWHQANISRLINDMERFGVSIAELQEAAGAKKAEPIKPEDAE